MLSGRNPWIAAFLNIITWGAGYLYIGHRRFLGAGLVIVFILNIMVLISIPYVVLLTYSEMLFTWGMFVWAMLSALFAIDVFNETRELRKI
jgi:hypothetical protein